MAKNYVNINEIKFKKIKELNKPEHLSKLLDKLSEITGLSKLDLVKLTVGFDLLDLNFSKMSTKHYVKSLKKIDDSKTINEIRDMELIRIRSLLQVLKTSIKNIIEEADNKHYYLKVLSSDELYDWFYFLAGRCNETHTLKLKFINLKKTEDKFQNLICLLEEKIEDLEFE